MDGLFVTQSNGFGVKGMPCKATSTIAVGVEAANAITCTITLKDRNSVACSNLTSLIVYISDDSAGVGECATAPATSVLAGASSGAFTSIVSKKLGLYSFKSDGTGTLVITETGTPTYYLVVVFPDGQRLVSGAITFA